MEYPRDVRDGLQPMRSFLTRKPLLASLVLALPLAVVALRVGVSWGSWGDGVSAAFWGLTGGATVLGLLNRPIVRWLTPPPIVLELNQADPDPNEPPANIEVLAQRERTFVEWYFNLKSDAESLLASGSQREKEGFGGCWDQEIASVVVAREDFVEAAQCFDRDPQDERALTPVEKYRRASQETALGYMFLLELHEFIHSATKPGGVPTAWMEGVTELASRTVAAEAVRFTRVKRVDPAFGVKYRDSYDRYVAGMSLVVLELSNLMEVPPELIIKGLVRAGCNPRGVKRFCSAVVGQCRVDSPEVEERLAKNFLEAFAKLKRGSFRQMKTGDLTDVREALRDLRFDLWCNGITKQPPEVFTDDPYQTLLQELGLVTLGPEEAQVAA